MKLAGRHNDSCLKISFFIYNGMFLVSFYFSIMIDVKIKLSVFKLKYVLTLFNGYIWQLEHNMLIVDIPKYVQKVGCQV